MTDPRPFREATDGVLITVRVTPRSSQDCLTGVKAAADGRVHLAAKVRAVPEKGAANVALERLIAAWLDVPKGSVSVVSGGTSRLKTVRVGGTTATLIDQVARALDRSFFK